MASNESKTIMSADDSQVARAWQRQFANYEKASQSLQKMAASSSRAGKTASDSWAQLPSILNHTRQIADSVIDTFARQQAATVQLIQERQETGVAEEEMLARLLAQQGTEAGTGEAERLKGQMRELAARYGNVKEAYAAVLEALQEGFQGDVAGPGGVADVYRQYVLATGRLKGQAGEIEQLGNILSSANLSKTSENLRRVTQAVQGTIGTDIGGEALGPIVQQAIGAIELGGMKLEESLAAIQLFEEARGRMKGARAFGKLRESLAQTFTGMTTKEALTAAGTVVGAQGTEQDKVAAARAISGASGGDLLYFLQQQGRMPAIAEQQADSARFERSARTMAQTNRAREFEERARLAAEEAKRAQEQLSAGTYKAAFERAALSRFINPEHIKAVKRRMDVNLSRGMDPGTALSRASAGFGDWTELLHPIDFLEGYFSGGPGFGGTSQAGREAREDLEGRQERLVAAATKAAAEAAHRAQRVPRRIMLVAGQHEAPAREEHPAQKHERRGESVPPPPPGY